MSCGYSKRRCCFSSLFALSLGSCLALFRPWYCEQTLGGMHRIESSWASASLVLAQALLESSEMCRSLFVADVGIPFDAARFDEWVTRGKHLMDHLKTAIGNQVKSSGSEGLLSEKSLGEKFDAWLAEAEADGGHMQVMRRFLTDPQTFMDPKHKVERLQRLKDRISRKDQEVFLIRKAAERSRPKKGWRNDGRCGKKFRAEDGRPGECPLPEQFMRERENDTLPWLESAPCCNIKDGWCGSSPNHCKCSFYCTDYRKLYANRQKAKPDDAAMYAPWGR